jgi:hypothetical protein
MGDLSGKGQPHRDAPDAMLARAARRLARPTTARRPLSSEIAVNQVSSVLKLNVGDEQRPPIALRAERV